LTEILHQQRSAIGILWREQEMDVVRHQDVGVNRARKLVGEPVQLLEIVCVIFRRVEARAAIVPALDCVQRNSSSAEAGAARQGATYGWPVLHGRAGAMRAVTVDSIREAYSRCMPAP
jgi:hypothetical protein